MKKNLLFISLMVAGTTCSFAQLTSRVNARVPVATTHARPVHAERNTTCTTDTLEYALVKEVLLANAASIAPAFWLDYLQGPGEEQSQAFISTEPVSVVGVNFRASVHSSNASAIVPTMVYLYSVNASYEPLARLDSALVTVSTTTPKYYNVNFATPHTVTGNYAVAVRPTTAFKINFVQNDRDAGTGGEGLSYGKFDAEDGSGNIWYTAEDLYLQDFDAEISPIVTYAVATDFTVSPSTTVCLGTPMTFTNTTTPSANLTNRMYNFGAFLEYFGFAALDSVYAWDMDNASPIIWSPNAAYTYPAAGAYDVTLHTLGGFWNSCTDTKTTTVNVNEIPVLAITSPAAVCSPSTVDITVPAVTTGSTGNGTLSYWTDAGATASLSTPSAVAAGGTYYIQSANGSCTDIEPVTVTINTTPVLSITSPAAVCSPSTVDLTAAAITAGSLGSGTLSYWTDAGATASLGSPETVAAGGTYYIQSANGSCTDIEPVTVTINAAEDATITDPGMLCDNGAAITLVAATAGGTWSGTGITDAANGTFNPVTATVGSHVVTYTTAGACPGTDDVTIVVSICTGVQSYDVAAMNVYPNPSTGVFTVDMGTAVTAVMEIYNVIGAKIAAQQSNTQVTSFDLSALNAGVYFLKVTTANGQTTKQITITK